MRALEAWKSSVGFVLLAGALEAAHSPPAAGPVWLVRFRQARQRKAASLHLVPGIVTALQPVPDVAHGHAIGPESVILDIRPRDRHGNRGCRPGSDRVGCDDGLAVGVPVDIDEEPAFALLLDELGGQMIGVA